MDKEKINESNTYIAGKGLYAAYVENPGEKDLNLLNNLQVAAGAETEKQEYFQNDWKYHCMFTGEKPKGIIKRIYYKIWLLCGASPGGLFAYDIGRKLKAMQRRSK